MRIKEKLCAKHAVFQLILITFANELHKKLYVYQEISHSFRTLPNSHGAGLLCS